MPLTEWILEVSFRLSLLTVKEPNNKEARTSPKIVIFFIVLFFKLLIVFVLFKKQLFYLTHKLFLKFKYNKNFGDI